MKVLAVFLAAVAFTSAAPSVSSGLKKALETQGTADIMVIMKAKTQSVLDAVESQNFVNTNAKAAHLYNELNRFTSSSQKEVLALLAKYKAAKVTGFYITNRISVQGADQHIVNALAHRDDVEEIREAKVITLESIIPKPSEEIGVKVLEWGVSQINAPNAWDAGFTGKGVVVSHIDTGVRYTHVALRDNFRAEYGWHDPYANTAMPNDGQGHGTHTMGSIAGRNGTGVAPEAQWISCKGCSTTSCTEEALIGCGQWTFCPDDNVEGCSTRPHLSSNSWGGGQEDAFYDEVINMWNSVDIIPIFAIGNSGPGCRTANSPGDRPNVISVGATNLQDAVAAFSSHGPTVTSNRIKPEVSAPGNNVRSCGIVTDTSYAIMSGTSMATPHVAGAAALLIQSGKTTRAQVAMALQDSTVRPQIDQIICTGGGVDPAKPWPNNSYGWGRIDVHAALQVGKK